MRKVKKIGILTFHRAVNYGAVLQSVALCNKLNEFGADSELIDYNCSEIFSMDSFITRLRNGGVKKAVEYVLLKHDRDIRKRKLTEFLEKNTTVSARKYNKATVLQCDSRYDSFITGSDQVWNAKRTGNDTIYYLDFVTDSTKKNSYAACIGNITDAEKKNIKKYLGDYAHISVREKDGQKEVEKILGRDVELLVDPTFLLTKEEWLKYVKVSSRDKYILVYTLAKSPELRTFARKLSEKTKLQIIDLSVRAEKFKGMRKVADTGIEEFLGYFANAEYIVTNSFHGTAFSIILQKPQFVGSHKDVSMGNSRLKTLLNIFNLSNRIITDSILDSPDSMSVDYASVTKKLETERAKAIEYLKGIISDD